MKVFVGKINNKKSSRTSLMQTFVNNILTGTVGTTFVIKVNMYKYVWCEQEKNNVEETTLAVIKDT